MCVPYSCLRCRCLYQWTRTANHLVQSCSAWHHREYRVLLFHHEIDQRSAAALSRFANRRRDLISTARRDSKKSEGLSEFGEIWAHQWRCGIATVVEELLPLPHHSQISVVDHSDVQIEFFLRCRGEFRHRHLESAVAGDHPDLRLGPCKLRSYGRRQCEPHSAEAAGSDQ